ncbi:MAG: agmatine deiminase family protein [Methanomassiliicoccales archaeon]|nr:agmatine deiminase family protein [Methanomassiliicoccales archaeon]
MEQETPRSAGYRMPAEWARHEATWLSWPKNPLTFPEGTLPAVEGIFAKMIAALSHGEKVKVLVEDQAMGERVEKLIALEGADRSNMILVPIRSADVWIRDYGPTFLLHRKTREKAAVKWTFNAWGGKYDDLLYDNITGEDIVRASDVRAFHPGIVLEGGSIDVNGAGTVLTTEQCLLNRNRNPRLDRAQIEQYLREYLNVERIIWLLSGIEGDDTDGHIDDFARFVSETEVVCAHSRDKAQANTVVLKRNLAILREAADQDGHQLVVRQLPMPKPLFLEGEERWLPASYANFYIGNECVLLPVFKDRNDAKAVQMLENAFPDREVVPIEAVELVYGYGGIHCVTQQEPTAKNDEQ